MNDGFFSSSQIKTYVKHKLPPSLNIRRQRPITPKIETKQESSSELKQMVMDIECYPNYFLVKFRRVDDDKILSFERTSHQELDISFIRAILKNFEIVTFNGNKYDVPMLRLAFTGAINKELKTASDLLIKKDPLTKASIPIWKFEEKYNLPDLKIKHIDLIELLPGKVSLKVYGGRLHCKKLQDLPYKESTALTDEEMDNVSEYCGNDLDLTKASLISRYPQIELRRVMSQKYGLNLLSKSDAQIAESVIKSEIEKLTGKKVERGSFEKDHFYYKAPAFIHFGNPKLKEAYDIVTTKPFVIGSDGKPKSPKELMGFKVKIGTTIYSMGRGGLHSTESKTFHIADSNYSIFDWDVSSYYPSVILNCGMYPKSLGKEFLDIYQTIVEERLEAKRNKDKIKADSYKIIINGSYGKLGQLYSVLYAPDLMLQVTITGQLAILMLIDKLESRGISVVSGNTDGVVIKCPKDKEDMMHNIIKRWMKETEFELESTNYVGIFSRDVNDYIAIKSDGSVKAKGCFRPSAIDKNPSNDVCSMAMVEYLKYGTPFEQTVKNCKDITKFVTVATVNGGAVKNGKYLGKAVRFYHAKNEKTAINYLENGNQVGGTEGAKPIMDFSIGFPEDVDYDWYVAACYELFGK